MPRPVIVSATRTAIGTLGGALAQLPATKLGAIAVREAVRRASLEPGQVEEVILGHVLPAGLGLNPGRVAALDAGIPKEVGSFTVNKACGSGLKAVVLAAQAIELGQADVMVAGGMESMSGAPYLLKKARFGIRMGHDELLDSMIADGLTCPITFVHMGVTAENIATKYGIPREEQDEFAAESQAKTAAGLREGARARRPPPRGDRPLGAERGLRGSVARRAARAARPEEPRQRERRRDRARAPDRRERLPHPRDPPPRHARARRPARRRLALHRRRARYRDGGRAALARRGRGTLRHRRHADCAQLCAALHAAPTAHGPGAAARRGAHALLPRALQARAARYRAGPRRLDGMGVGPRRGARAA